MKYLRKFQTNADYQAYKGGGDWVTPNVSLITGDNNIVYEPLASAVSLITFTIYSVEYQAEEGMTWGEWVDSEYNTKSDTFTNHDPYIHAGGESFICSENEAEDGYLNTRVRVDDIIISNKTYYYKSISPVSINNM